LFKGEALPARAIFFYRGTRIFAVRKGPWKLHLFTQKGYGQPKPDAHDPPLLFNLNVDPGENYNVATNHPTVIADLLHEIELHRATVTPVKLQLKEVRPLENAGKTNALEMKAL
jgi:arylsulfatase